MIMTTHLGDETGKWVLVDFYGLIDGAYLAAHEVLKLIYIMDLTGSKDLYVLQTFYVYDIDTFNLFMSKETSVVF